MNRRPSIRLLTALAVLISVSAAFAQTTRPISQVDHVLIISIDGCRPDVLLRAKAPNLRSMMDGGAFTMWAQTVPMAITLPSHVSMLTGVSVEKHGIRFNDERATTRPFYPNATTIFEVAKKAGYTTALVSGKSKFMALNKPRTIDWLDAPESAKTTDANVAEAAIAMIQQHKPQLMFLHFPGADTAGHANGWASPQQFAALESIDAAIGMVLASLKAGGLDQSTVIIVSADHGGSGKTHGANDQRSLHIPWIAYGPGLRKNLDLTTFRDLNVKTEDTFATACYLLGMPLPDGVDGKPVRQIVLRSELLEDAPARNRSTTAPSSAAEE